MNNKTKLVVCNIIVILAFAWADDKVSSFVGKITGETTVHLAYCKNSEVPLADCKKSLSYVVFDEIDFRADLQTQAVFVKKTDSLAKLNNCSVFDFQNWYCTDKYGHSFSMREERYQETTGAELPKYQSYVEQITLLEYWFHKISIF